MEIGNARNAPFDVEFIEGVNLGQFSLDNDIIPHRNTIMALLASNYGNKIYIGATKGDTTRDKDWTWKSQMDGLLNYFGEDTHKVAIDEYPFEVRMPVKDLTKTQILEKYLDEGGDPQELVDYSRSCYNGEDGLECGRCRSCIRKAIAFWLNDLERYMDQTFNSDPLEHIGVKVHEKMLSREGEAQDYELFLEEHPEFEL